MKTEIMISIWYNENLNVQVNGDSINRLENGYLALWNNQYITATFKGKLQYRDTIGSMKFYAVKL